MTAPRQAILTLLACTGALVLTSARTPKDVQTRIFHCVQTLDSASNTWRTLTATARLTHSAGRLSITIWNNWGDEQINPTVRLILSDHPAKDTAARTWHYSGTLFRSAGNGKNCILETCTKIANTQNPDFRIIGTDYSVRYRMSRKTPEKP